VNKRRLARILYILWIIITLIAISIPSGKIPQMKALRGLDKTVHAGLFAVMGVLGQTAFPWLSILISTPIALGTEFLQRVLPTQREYEQADLLSNLIGLFLGIVCYELSIRLR
jgi:hypothetical protein